MNQVATKSLALRSPSDTPPELVWLAFSYGFWESVQCYNQSYQVASIQNGILLISIKDL